MFKYRENYSLVTEIRIVVIIYNRGREGTD